MKKHSVLKKKKSRSAPCINLIEHCVVMLWQWLILDYLERSRIKIIIQFVVNITHNYRMYYPGSNTRMSPWLWYCLSCMHGLNLYIPGSYLPLLHLTDVITSSILLEKAGKYTYTWRSKPGGWQQGIPGEYWHLRLPWIFFPSRRSI